MAAVKSSDVRCEGCGKMLGKIQAGGLFVVKRADLEVTYDGTGQVIIRCPNPICGNLRILKLPYQQPAA